MAELKPFEVIMRLSPYAAQNKNEICFHAEKVTELVRCKDCNKHTDENKELHEVWCEAYEAVKSENGYCDWGERKNEVEE